MLYLSAQKVVAPGTGRTGINAFRYRGAVVHSFELLQTSDPGVLEVQRIEVPPGGNDVLCYLDVLAPDSTERTDLEPLLRALRDIWTKDRRGSAELDEMRALFVPGRTPIESTERELTALVAELLAVASAAPSPPALHARPITILVARNPDGKRYRVEAESAQRLRHVHGPGWRQASVMVDDDVTSDYANVGAPVLGELTNALVTTLTGLDVVRLHSEFGGVRVIEEATRKTIWEWPPADVRPGYCLSCHQHGTLRDAGQNALVCANCGNTQMTDGLWVGALS